MNFLIEQRLLGAHALAAVVSSLFPHTILLSGGINSLGFYYDFIFEKPLNQSLLELIEIQLSRFIKEEHPVRSISMMRENAQMLFEHYQHFFLAKQAGDQNSNILDLVQIGEEYYGLCPSLSLASTQEISYLKLLGFQEHVLEIDGNFESVIRVFGNIQKSAKEAKTFLKNYSVFLKKRDHRLLGPKLNLFSFPKEMGDLGVIWHPKGLQLQRLLQDWLRQQFPQRVSEISTPLAIRQEFFDSASHALQSFAFKGENYKLRPSFLRQHLQYLTHFSSKTKDQPWQVIEYAPVYRNYPQPQWWGLFCQCGYLTDHMTISCLEEQVFSQLISSLLFIEEIIRIFGFEAHWYLIAYRQKNSKVRHQKEIKWLKEAIKALNLSYSEEEKEEEEEDLPRFELRIRDTLAREWPISILSIVQQKWIIEEPRRVTLKCQIWESLDRFIALLIEHYEGNLPFWLVPEQVRILAIGEASQEYAQEVFNRILAKGLRVTLDSRLDKLAIRIHEAEKEQVPYLILIGEQERLKQKISVRSAKRHNQNETVDLDFFLNRLDQQSRCPKISLIREDNKKRRE